MLGPRSRILPPPPRHPASFHRSHLVHCRPSTKNQRGVSGRLHALQVNDPLLQRARFDPLRAARLYEPIMSAPRTIVLALPIFTCIHGTRRGGLIRRLPLHIWLWLAGHAKASSRDVGGNWRVHHLLGRIYFSWTSQQLSGLALSVSFGGLDPSSAPRLRWPLVNVCTPCSHLFSMLKIHLSLWL